MSIRRPLLRGFVVSDAAATAVEFALVAPLFLAMLFGILIFGSHLATVHSVQQLAAEAARTSVAGLNDSERRDLATNYIATNAASDPLLNADRLKVNAAASAGDANVFIVTISYDASGSAFYALPFVPAPSSQISRSAAIPRGGY